MRKGIPPEKVFRQIDNVFRSLDLTKDYSLFDIKILKRSEKRLTFRLRKGKYRALFYEEDGDLYVFRIDKREDIYRK